MKIGDIVVRKSYDKDIIFKIIDLFNWITLFSNNINYLNAT